MPRPRRAIWASSSRWRRKGAPGITANAVCPGYIATEMVMAIPRRCARADHRRIPAGRLGEPEEIARCVASWSDDAGFINGSTISANGAQFFV
jgi:acetoacetyl-CoA reductase